MNRLEFAERLAAKLNRPAENLFRIYSSPDYIDHYVFSATFDVSDAYRQELGGYDQIERQAIDNFAEELQIIEAELANLLLQSSSEEAFYEQLDEITKGYGFDLRAEGKKSRLSKQTVNLNFIAKHLWTAFAVPVRTYGPYAVRIHPPIHIANVPQVSLSLANYVLAENFLAMSNLMRDGTRLRKRLSRMMVAIVVLLGVAGVVILLR